jgi:predicted DNA-binding transcriptional regulator AlpA
MADDNLLKPSELARKLGVSRSWLYEAAKTGRVPSIRIGGADGPLRFVPEDITRWIDDARGAHGERKPQAAAFDRTREHPPSHVRILRDNDGPSGGPT